MSHTEKKHDQYYEMANAPISHIIPKLAAPTIVSMLISSIYNMADTFFVSQLGTSASGAVGVIFSAMSIIQALAFMIGMGSGNYMTRSLGAGKRELAEQIVSIAFFTGIRRNRNHCTLCRSLCPLYFHCSTLYDLLFYYEQPAAFPGKSFFCHGWHYSRRSFKYCTGSAVYLYSGHGNCRCCFSYRTFPVYQFLYPFMDVQSSGQLHFHQHPQIPPETGDLSRGPLWRHPIFRTSGNCQCGYDPDELYVSALW